MEFETMLMELSASLMIGILICAIFFGAICQCIGSNKGRKWCFWYGFCFGWIGLIIVLCLKNKEMDYSAEKNKYESLEKLEQLKQKGSISQEEFDSERKKLLQ